MVDMKEGCFPPENWGLTRLAGTMYTGTYISRGVIQEIIVDATVNECTFTLIEKENACP
jgi:hypothetical protein